MYLLRNGQYLPELFSVSQKNDGNYSSYVFYKLGMIRQPEGGPQAEHTYINWLTVINNVSFVFAFFWQIVSSFIYRML